MFDEFVCVEDDCALSERFHSCVQIQITHIPILHCISTFVVAFIPTNISVHSDPHDHMLCR